MSSAGKINMGYYYNIYLSIYVFCNSYHIDLFFSKSILGIYFYQSLVKLKKKIKEKEECFPHKSQIANTAHSEGHFNSNLFWSSWYFGNISAYFQNTVSNLDFMVKHLGFFFSPLSCIYYIHFLLLQKIKIGFVKTQELQD